MINILRIAGTDYAASDRAAGPILIDGWGWDLDGDSEIEFHEVSPGISPRWHGNQAVKLTVDGTVRAAGVITTVDPMFSEDENWTFSYRVRGFKFAMNQIPVVATDGTGNLVYNLPVTDDDYIAAMSGQSIAQILADVTTRHATALAAIGIASDATTTANLTASDLATVPYDPVYFTGERLGNAYEQLLRTSARNFCLYITPAGKLRYLDTTAGSALTLTKGTDPILAPHFRTDVTDCNTRVQVRGKGKIYPAYVSLGRSTLAATWTGGQQTSWKYSNFTTPADAYAAGAINTIVDSVTIRVQPGGTYFWSTNFWNVRQGWIHLHNPGALGLLYAEAAPVTACTSLTPGGTSDITIGYALENAGAGAYTQFELIGTYAASGLVDVWRLFNVTDPGLFIASHLVRKFPAPVAFLSYSGGAAALTSYPGALVVNAAGASFPMSFAIRPTTGQILFNEPVVKPYNTQANLNTGGSSVVAPSDIYCLLAYSRGALTASYPVDVAGAPVYAGKGFTGPEAIRSTKYVDVDSWVYVGNTAQMQAYAQMLHKSMSDPVVTGDVTYLGAYTAAFAPGLLLSIAGNGYTTGYETLAVPVRGFRIDYQHSAGSGTLYRSKLRCSSARNPTRGDRQYLHPTTLEQASGLVELAGTLDLSGFAGYGNQIAGPAPYPGTVPDLGACTPAPMQAPDLPTAPAADPGPDPFASYRDWSGS